jgi:hypothetical protein
MNEKPIKFYFSLFGGDIYSVAEDEIEFLDAFQIPLSAKPNKNCKKCHDRLYVGYNIITKQYELCTKCARKFIDRDALLKQKK